MSESDKIAFNDLFELQPHPFTNSFPKKLQNNPTNQEALRKIKADFFKNRQQVGGGRNNKTLKRSSNKNGVDRTCASIGSMYTSKNNKHRSAGSMQVTWTSIDSLGESLRDEGNYSDKPNARHEPEYNYANELVEMNMDNIETIKI